MSLQITFVFVHLSNPSNPTNVSKKMISATAQSVQTMITGRLIAGIGIGISSAIVPLYISEVVWPLVLLSSPFKIVFPPNNLF